MESLKRNYGGFNEGLPSYEETNFGVDNRADQIMLPSDHQASLLIFYHTVLALSVVALNVYAELRVIFRLVLNELKIKLDGVNESEESINGDFDQPRFGIPISVIFAGLGHDFPKMVECEILNKDLHHALDFAVFYYS